MNRDMPGDSPTYDVGACVEVRKFLEMGWPISAMLNLFQHRMTSYQMYYGVC
jgi:hypothetical protein